MNITKKQWACIGIVILVAVIIWYFFLRKKKPAESSYNADAMCKLRGCKGAKRNGQCYGCKPAPHQFTGTVGGVAGSVSERVGVTPPCPSGTIGQNDRPCLKPDGSVAI